MEGEVIIEGEPEGEAEGEVIEEGEMEGEGEGEHENRPPDANAGPDQTVPLGILVFLDGSASTDPDGDPISYTWSFMSKPETSMAELTDAVSARPTFIADVAGAYELHLVVNDGLLDSEADSVTVRIGETFNTAPIAHAGSDQTVPISTEVRLDGSLSADVEGDLLTYQWSFTKMPEGANVALSDPTSDRPIFMPDTVGVYILKLVVNDGNEDSDPDFVTITATTGPLNTAPRANAGADRTMYLAAVVGLDGTGSYDADGDPLIYGWSMTSIPQGSNAQLSDAHAAKPEFTVDVTGDYIVQLIVNDGFLDSAPDTVVISVEENRPPQVMVESTYAVQAGQTLSIPVAATDPDNDVVTLSAAPLLNHAVFSTTPGTEAAGTFSLTPDESQRGARTVVFTARDPMGLTGQKRVTINVTGINHPPVLTVPETITVNEGGLVNIRLNVTDPDGDALTITVAWPPNLELPSNMLFIPPAATITFAPDYEQAGTYDIVCEASDGDLLSGPRVMRVVVNNVEDDGTHTELNLVVDPPESPTLLDKGRITGVVNATGQLPPPQRITTALITGVSPSQGKQGQTFDVVLAGKASDAFQTHFANGVSTADFGAGIKVNSTSVTGPFAAVVNITIAGDAAPGTRSIRVVTGDETAVSMVAFNVLAGGSSITGRVVDPATGAPIAGAIVSIEGTGISTETDENGTYVLDNVPAGPQCLIINPPDHELIRRDINIQSGVSADLGATETASIVFDPNAPPSATTYSVIGRRATETISRLTFGQAREVIRDAMLMVGGDEAGVLDEYGNQVNPGLTGAGLMSMKPKAIDMLADRMVCNETVSLQEVLYVLSIAFAWSNGYPDLGEWLSFLQFQVNDAWRDPTNPENGLMVLLFNKQQNIAFDPPVLSPFTRLNALQAHLLISSILAAGIDEQYPGEKGIASPDKTRAGVKSVGKNYFTRYWRNFFVTKDSYLQNSMMQGAVAELGVMASWMTAASTGGILGAVIGANLAGTAPSYLDDAAINANVTLHIPEPPVMVRADVVTQPDKTRLVEVVFQLSPSDIYNQQSGGTVHYIYNLYRFHGDTEERDLIEAPMVPADQPNTVKMTDSNPLVGLHYYAVNVTRYTGVRSDPTESWWPSAFHTGLDIFRKGGHRLTSDYSAPVTVYTGPGDLSVTLDGLEPDPDPYKDIVYYSDAGNGVLYKIENSGSGPRTLFASGGFKPSFRDGRQIIQYGLAIDSSGSLYCDNNASNDSFGGRLFRYAQPDGARDFCGTIKYFSQMLMFAHPCDAGPMVMSPAASLAEEDMYIVENLNQEVLRVPVNASYDPMRRVGQSFAAIPPGGWGRAIDAEFSHDRVYYLLDGWRVIKRVGDVWKIDAYFTQD